MHDSHARDDAFKNRHFAILGAFFLFALSFTSVDALTAEDTVVKPVSNEATATPGR